MGKYSSGRRGSSKYGDKKSSRYSEGSRRGRRDADEDDEYYEDEEPRYVSKKYDQHERNSLVIFGVIIGVILLVVIIAMTGPSKAQKEALGVEGKKAEERKVDEREAAASEALGEAISYDRQNPYEEKEIVAERYSSVFSQYPGTKAADEARKKHDEVMGRRR
ncbi:MAG: hypothetical protein ABIH42_01655 [Planctomycetota bacterium]